MLIMVLDCVHGPSLGHYRWISQEEISQVINEPFGIWAWLLWTIVAIQRLITTAIEAIRYRTYLQEGVHNTFNVRLSNTDSKVMSVYDRHHSNNAMLIVPNMGTISFVQTSTSRPAWKYDEYCHPRKDALGSWVHYITCLLSYAAFASHMQHVVYL